MFLSLRNKVSLSTQLSRQTLQNHLLTLFSSHHHLFCHHRILGRNPVFLVSLTRNLAHDRVGVYSWSLWVTYMYLEENERERGKKKREVTEVSKQEIPRCRWWGKPHGRWACSPPVRDAYERKVNEHSKPGLEITERSKDSIPRVLTWELGEQSIRVCWLLAPDAEKKMADRRKWQVIFYCFWARRYS